jgi:pyruvate formate lyase activating enzyme
VKIECTLCPHACRLAEYEIGLCRVRIHRGGKLYSLVHGKACAVHVDPIEKKPIFHMLPGSGAYSVATAGCNLACRFCQNWEISQAKPEQTRSRDLPPARIVAEARAARCRSVAYTYTEPTVFFEYMLESARLARAAELRNIWVTAGFVNPEPLRELAPFMDAANIDIKSMREGYYRDVCGARLQPVLDAVALAVKLGVMVEITYLIVPTLNDSLDEIRDLARWLKSTVGAEVPLHFSRFFPQYRLERLPPTPLETITSARNVALAEGLRHVYTGNVPHDESANTFCAHCGTRLISRLGYTVREMRVRGGACPDCGGKVYGIWS